MSKVKKRRPVSKILVMDTDEWLGSPSTGGKEKEGEKEETDEVEEALRKAARLKANRLRMRELDRYLQETEKELKELKEEAKGKEKEKEKEKEEGKEARSEVTPGIALELAKLSEEQRNLVLQTYAALKGAEKGESASAYMLPMLIGFARTYPQAQQTDMAKFVEVVTNQIKTGMELARAGQPSAQPSFDPIALVKTFAEVVRDNVQKPLEEVVQRIQPQPSAFEQLLMNDTLFERAKSLGMFGGSPQKAPPEILLEIERLKEDRAIELEKLRTEREQWAAKFGAEQRADERRWQVVMNLMQGPLGRVVERIGGAAASRLQGEGQERAPPRPVLVSCPSCGGTFYASSDARIAACPHCQTLLRAEEGGVKVGSGSGSGVGVGSGSEEEGAPEASPGAEAAPEARGAPQR